MAQMKGMSSRRVMDDVVAEVVSVVFYQPKMCNQLVLPPVLHTMVGFIPDFLEAGKMLWVLVG